MARIRIRNSTDHHRALSFAMLFVGRSCTVDESKLRDCDRQAIERYGLTVEDPDAPAPVKEDSHVPDRPAAPAAADVQPEPQNEIPAQPAAASLGGAPGPGGADRVEPPAPKHSREGLEKLSRKDLKALAEKLGVKARARADLIEGIIKAEER